MRRILALALVALAVPSGAAAQVAPQPEVSLQYQNLVAARVNPLGLVDYARFSLRLRLYESDSPILTQNYIGIGVTPAISPGWGRVGAIVEVQPLTILRLWAQYDFHGYFSTFNLFASFPGAASEYSDTVVRERGEMDPTLASYATYGGVFTTGALLQMKIGPVAARNTFRAVWASYDMQRGDRAYYDQIWDTLLPNEGWMIINELDVLGLFDVDQFGFALGARWSYTLPFYDEGHFAPGTSPPAPNHEIHRLGPIFAWTLDRSPGGRFDQPQIIVIAQWHLQHRYRTGADVHVGLPYLALAFKFQGDLLADR